MNNVMIIKLCVLLISQNLIVSMLFQEKLNLKPTFKYLDPCAANGFMGDIALTEKEKYSMLERDALEFAQTRSRLNISTKYETKEIKTKWLNYYKSFKLQPFELQTLMKLRFTFVPFSVRRKTLSRHKRAATSYKYRTWPDGIIPYYIESNFSSETKATMMKAMRHWENYTCLSFVPKKSSDKSYIIFTEKACGCCSYVGRRNADEPQAISIGKNCDKTGIVIHELGHVIGFWHEHTRPDRDDHVEILLENVVVGQDFNFKKMKPEEVDSLNEPYDYQSIMHYAKETFSKANKEWTIRPKACCPRPTIGQRIKLSDGDIRQTKKLYNCKKCGRTLLDYSNRFQSPEKDQNPVSSSPVDCEWKIAVTEGERIQLNITSLSYLNSGDCIKNYLEIRDGIHRNSVLLGKFCSTSKVPIIVSTGPRLWIKYYNEVPTKFSGFLANYKAVCGGEIHSHNGQIMSTNYPEKYQSNKLCVWKIKVSPGYSIALKFESFKVEKHDTCVYDYLEIHDGLTESAPLLAKICGYHLPGPIKSTNNTMYVKFISDSSVEKQGFVANFQKEYDECKTQKHGCQHICVNTLGGYRCACDIGYELQSDGKTCENACGGIIKESNGSLHSPNYPRLYPGNKKCIWRIQATSKAKIFLNFTEFDVEGKEKDCQYDYVNIFDGPESKQKKIGKFCGKKLPQPITSTTNELKIAFYSDGTVQKKGFKVYYFTDQNECADKNGGCDHHCINTIGSYYCRCNTGFHLHGKKRCKEKTGNECNYEINDSSGIIMSPNHPISYPINSDCKWKIATIPGHVIELKFEDFEIESHHECTYDKLLIYDGPDTKSRQLGKYCGSKTPLPIKSSLNSVMLIFKSDSSVRRRGFKIRFSSLCDGKLTASTKPQVIYSHANYGGAYGKNQLCFWTIESPRSDYTVQLKFLHFEIEPENQCTYDSVKIYDGPTVLNPVIGQYCGTTIPQIIKSSSGTLLISFVSDDTVNAKGFKAEYTAVYKGKPNSNT